MRRFKNEQCGTKLVVQRIWQEIPVVKSGKGCRVIGRDLTYLCYLVVGVVIKPTGISLI